MNIFDDKRPIKLFDLLVRTAPNKVFISIILGIFAGLAYALIIPLILLSLNTSPSEFIQPEINRVFYIGDYEISTPKFALLFLILCVFILVTRTTSSILLNKVSIDATKGLREYIYERISLTPVRDLEKIGPSKLIAAITTDVPRLVMGAGFYPAILMNLATLFGLLGFLIFLNINVFIFIVATILTGVVTYRVPVYIGRRYMTKARAITDNIHEGIRGLIYGAKELKLNKQKQQSFIYDELHTQEEEVRRYGFKGSSLMIAANSYGDLISFFAIGVVAYAISNFYLLSTETLIGVIMALLYITGPVGMILNSMTPIMQASVSLKKLKAILNELSREEAGSSEVEVACQQVRVAGIKYNYVSENDDDTEFILGPIDLTLKRNEVTFLVGGNGSGKTTLGKVLTLHYIPHEGEIYFDKEKVSRENLEQCRQYISAIYSDFYLFSKLYGFDREQINPLVSKYLKELGLEKKVVIQDGQFSTIALSDGQRKRLALLVAYLDDRTIYVFDEWAADQDPEFKKVFYYEILPNLKEMGKIVVVISHDDRYFHLADKIVKMENGRITGIEYNTMENGRIIEIEDKAEVI